MIIGKLSHLTSPIKIMAPFNNPSFNMVGLLKMKPSSQLVLLRRMLFVTLAMTCVFMTLSNWSMAGMQVEITPKGVLINEALDMFPSLERGQQVRLMYRMSKLLLNASNDGDTNLKLLRSHFSVLRSRKFPKSTRPKTCNGCMTYSFKTLIGPGKMYCQAGHGVVLFILITSVPQETAERNIVRNTWARFTGIRTAKVRHLFLFGGGYSVEDQLKIKKESHLYGDILQANYVDSYYNLTYKVLMGYHWIARNCPEAQFVLRTACDNFINVPALKSYLKTAPLARLTGQLGYREHNNVIFRHPNSKWYISPEELNSTSKYYPDFCTGSAFVFSQGAMKKLLMASPNVPFFALEDVYFGLVMEQIKMPVRHVPGFHISIKDKDLKTCPEPPVYTIHEVSPENMQKLWSLCKKQPS